MIIPLSVLRVEKLVPATLRLTCVYIYLVGSRVLPYTYAGVVRRFKRHKYRFDQLIVGVISNTI